MYFEPVPGQALAMVNRAKRAEKLSEVNEQMLNLRQGLEFGCN